MQKQELIKINTIGEILCWRFTKSLQYTQIEIMLRIRHGSAQSTNVIFCNFQKTVNKCQNMTAFCTKNQLEIRAEKKLTKKTCANAFKLIVHTCVRICVCVHEELTKEHSKFE